MIKKENFRQAYIDLLGSGLLTNEIILKHVDRYSVLDSQVQTQASFFYIIETGSGIYHFLGKQQEWLSGVPNDEFRAGGISSFINRLHQEDLPIIINEVYNDFTIWFKEREPSIRKEDMVFHYNYRFLNRHSQYDNVMEHVYILEVDKEEMPSLLLGNVIHLGNSGALPLKSSMNVHRRDIIETVAMRTYNRFAQSYNLTKREIDILKNLVSGKNSKEIAQQLFISHHTVDTHRRNLLKKMGCSSVVAMARIAFKEGFF